ncbi:MAG: hypothetical protein ACLP9L_41590 [Thermoguttaceae bacterium]
MKRKRKGTLEEALITTICITLFLAIMLGIHFLSQQAAAKLKDRTPIATPAKDTATALVPVAPKPAPTPESFDWAVQQSALTGKPACALISADWCGPCRRLERELLPELKSSGAFDPPYLCELDVDKDRSRVEALVGPGEQEIPAFVLFSATAGGELKPINKLSGVRSAAVVTSFLHAPHPSTEPAAGKQPACVAPALTGKTQECTPRLLRRLFRRR